MWQTDLTQFKNAPKANTAVICVLVRRVMVRYCWTGDDCCMCVVN